MAAIATPLIIHSLTVECETDNAPTESEGTSLVIEDCKRKCKCETETVQESEAVEETSKPVEYITTDDIPLPHELQIVMQKACEKYGVPYALALAVAESESSFDLEADSGTCWGVMQIHPINYERLRMYGIEPTEYEGNITAGVFILGELLEKYTDTHKALMAYNCGETGARRLWNEGYYTTKYSEKVVTLSEKWQKTINDN